MYHQIPSSGTGTSGTNYDETTYGYETSHMARQNMVKTPGGTITRTVYDANQVVGTYVGTNDNSASDNSPIVTNGINNMVRLVANTYDGGAAGKDGNLTQSYVYVDASGTNDRTTTYLYDFRNRQTVVDGEVDFYLLRTYDNLDRVTQVDRYNTTSGGDLVARSQTLYDDLGDVYQSVTVAVTPSSGATGNTLTDNTWYDPSGNVLKQQPAGAGRWTKFTYDSVGRQVWQYVGYTDGTVNYAEASSLTDSIVFEQTKTTFDAASNVIQTDRYQRFHNAPASGSGSKGRTQWPLG